MIDKKVIRLEIFDESDFDTLIAWIKDEIELVQFAGPIFNFPLTTEQLRHYISDNKRHVFKVIFTATNKSIGHCEVYQSNDYNCRLCRVLIGDKGFRGKGIGKLLVKQLTDWAFCNLNAHFVDLNVFDFNLSAIKSYENVGFEIIGINESTIKINNEIWTSLRMKIDKEKFYSIIRA